MTQADYNRRYRERHPDRRKASAKKHRETVQATPELRERRNTYDRSRWKDNRSVWQREYKATVKETRFFHWRVSSFNHHCGTSYEAKHLARLWRQQRGLCALTGSKLTRDAEIDHRLSTKRGGTHELTNLQWVAKAANRAKQDLTDQEFVALCRTVVDYAERLLEQTMSKQAGGPGPGSP